MKPWYTAILWKPFFFFLQFMILQLLKFILSCSEKFIHLYFSHEFELAPPNLEIANNVKDVIFPLCHYRK